MENLRRKNNSGDKFSFPSMQIYDKESEFEFGSVTPGSPDSPADHLFFNGRLLPHQFPFQPTSIYSRSTSSVSSKDSLMSSRSNSRGSSSSSARTSTSEVSDSSKISARAKLARKAPLYNRPVLAPQYASSQKWQFITPTPTVLNRQVSRPKREEKKKATGRPWFGRRLFRSFVSACKECHAIEPSRKASIVLQGDVELQK